MTQNHPTPRELEGVVLGGLSAEQARTVVLHLLRGCPTCNLELVPYISRRLGSARRPPVPADAYDAPIDRAFASLGLKPPLHGTGKGRKRKALDVLTAGGLNALAAKPPLLRGVPLFETLLEGSWSLRHHDPQQSVELAQAATFLADHLSPDEVGVQALADLRFRAWTELANVYRAADDLDEADRAIERATDYIRLGRSDELLLTRFLTVFASQHAARRKLDLACTTLDVVAALYLQHGNAHLAGRAFIMRGIFTGYSDKPEEAILIFDQGLSMIDEERDPGLVFAALQSRSWCLVDCGRFGEAHRASLDLRRRAFEVGGKLGALKLRWLEGHIHAGLNKLDIAERALGQVMEGFEEAGLGYKAALAGLERAEVLLRQNRIADAEGLALRCADAFLALGIRRELVAAVLVVRKAAETHYLNLVVLQDALHKLRREDRNPAASPLEGP